MRSTNNPRGFVFVFVLLVVTLVDVVAAIDLGPRVRFHRRSHQHPRSPDNVAPGNFQSSHSLALVESHRHLHKKTGATTRTSATQPHTSMVSSLDPIYLVGPHQRLVASSVQTSNLSSSSICAVTTVHLTTTVYVNALSASKTQSSHVPTIAIQQPPASSSTQAVAPVLGSSTPDPFSGTIKYPAQSSVASSSQLSSSSSTSLKSSSISTSTVTQSTSSTSSSSSVASTSSVVYNPGPIIKYAQSLSQPQPGNQKLHGQSSNSPSSQYLPWTNPGNQKLPSDVLVPGVNGKLSTEYAIAPDTGVLAIDSSSSALLKPLKGTPHMSRDGGKGGYLNGQKLFIFCDTGSYTAATAAQAGSFLGFVSSSCAVDKGNNAKFGKPIAMEDGIGQWSDDSGRMRGFCPLTQGEQSYNLALQGAGHRYAVWPESSIIPLNQTTALLYAPIVYLDVDMATKGFSYTYTGNTLLEVTVQSQGGPRAVRIVEKIFAQDEVEWGTIGGIRSYGGSGVGGNDGKVYVFGGLKDGLLIGRVDAAKVSEKSSYEYWDGTTWGKTIQTRQSTAYFIRGSFMDGDIFYSPAHLTFIFVYINAYADNTFYYRYLQTDKPILPSYVQGGTPNTDFVENLVKYKWSDEKVLYKAASGPTDKYVYAGGVQAGYFDEDDITNGGKKMLISWTVPTGANPAAVDSEYFFITAEIDWA